MNRLQETTQKINKMFYPTKIYAVGGCVRDTKLGREPKDFDFTCELMPDKIEEIIKKNGRRVYSIGKKFGTLGFKIQLDNGDWQLVEITTFRTEKYTQGSRKPEVEFISDLKEDLSRRDFSMNAIAYDGEKFIDYFGGTVDIIKKNIVCVGRIKDRFKEDPLRMLRAIRFASQLDFDIDPNILGIIKQRAGSILDISIERCSEELNKTLIGKNPNKALRLLHQTGLTDYLLPELSYCLTYYNIEDLEPNDDTSTQWARILKYIDKFPLNYKTDFKTNKNSAKLRQRTVEEIANRLKWSNKMLKDVLNKL